MEPHILSIFCEIYNKIYPSRCGWKQSEQFTILQFLVTAKARTEIQELKSQLILTGHLIGSEISGCGEKISDYYVKVSPALWSRQTRPDGLQYEGTRKRCLTGASFYQRLGLSLLILLELQLLWRLAESAFFSTALDFCTHMHSFHASKRVTILQTKK